MTITKKLYHERRKEKKNAPVVNWLEQACNKTIVPFTTEFDFDICVENMIGYPVAQIYHYILSMKQLLPHRSNSVC